MEAKTGAIGAALIAAAATVTAAVIQVIDSDGTGPPPSIIKVDDTVKDAPKPQSSGLETLLAHLPDTLTACGPADTPVMALARARCTAAPTNQAPAATLYLTLFPDLEHTRADFARQVPPVVEATKQVCPNGPDRSDYEIPNEGKAGLLACWVANDGRPYVVWTRDAAGIVAIAQGQEGSTVQDLWPVWINAPIRGADPAR
jgi:hypothetical protein